MNELKLYCLLKVKKNKTSFESFVFNRMARPEHEDYIHTLFVLRDEGYMKDVETIVHDKEGREFLASFPNRNFVFTDKGVKAIPVLIRKCLLKRCKGCLEWILKLGFRSLIWFGYIRIGMMLFQ